MCYNDEYLPDVFGESGADSRIRESEGVLVAEEAPSGEWMSVGNKSRTTRVNVQHILYIDTTLVSPSGWQKSM